MLRTLAASLLVANLLFWAWSHWSDDDSDELRLRRQVAPEQMSIVEAPATPASSASAP